MSDLDICGREESFRNVQEENGVKIGQKHGKS